MCLLANLVAFFDDVAFRRGMKALRRFIADPADLDEQEQREELDRLASLNNPEGA